jgi:NADPH:quinone reductase
MSTKDEMRAVVIDRFGGPEVLSVRRLPVPEIKPDQILIRVGSAGVGIWDVAAREGRLAPMMERLYGIKVSFPYPLGSEGAGTVEGVGENVSGFRNGDLVYADAWGTNPRAGFDAEYIAVGAERAVPIPSNLTVEQAGALYIDGAIALYGLDDTLGLKPDQKLMIFGASGGIGHLAVQLARRMGVQVFAVASREDGVALARRLGAEAVVEGHGDDVAASAREFAPDGFDAALIAVRGQVAEAVMATESALTTVRDGGRVAYPWADSMRPAPRAPPNVQALSYSLVNSQGKIPRELMSKLNRVIEAGPFEVHLDKTFSLDRVADAHEALSSHYTGRLALLP